MRRASSGVAGRRGPRARRARRRARRARRSPSRGRPSRRTGCPRARRGRGRPARSASSAIGSSKRPIPATDQCAGSGSPSTRKRRFRSGADIPPGTPSTNCTWYGAARCPLLEEPAERVEHPGVVDLALGHEPPLAEARRDLHDVRARVHEDVVAEVHRAEVERPHLGAVHERPEPLVDRHAHRAAGRALERRRRCPRARIAVHDLAEVARAPATGARRASARAGGPPRRPPARPSTAARAISSGVYGTCGLCARVTSAPTTAAATMTFSPMAPPSR